MVSDVAIIAMQEGGATLPPVQPGISIIYEDPATGELYRRSSDGSARSLEVGFSGAYGDLTNAPTLGTAAAADISDFATPAQVALKANSADLAAVATSGDYNDLINTPSLGTASASSISDFATAQQGGLADSALQSGDNVSELANDAGYIVGETLTSLAIVGNELRYTDEDGSVTPIDLTVYLDDSNLSRISSGSLDGATGVVTFTRDDSSTFDIDLSDLIDADQTSTTVANLSSVSGATVTAALDNLNSALGGKANSADLAAVATSGDYIDLTNTPSLGSAATSSVSDFATAQQGSLADSALQSGDNVSELVNDAGYIAGETVTNLSRTTSGVVYENEDGVSQTANFLSLVTSAQRLALTVSKADQVYDTDLDCVCTYNGTVWVYKANVVLSGAEVTTSSSMTAVNGLETPSLEPGKYVLRARVITRSSATFNGITLRCNSVGASVSSILVNWSNPDRATSSVNGVQHWTQENNTDDTAVTDAPVSNQDYLIEGEGVFSVTSGGSIGVSFRNRYNGYVATLQAGSVLEIEKVA